MANLCFGGTRLNVRRIVTGQKGDGESVFVEDEEITALTPMLLQGIDVWRLWGQDGVPKLPNDGLPPDAAGYFPSPLGYGVGMWALSPAGHDPATIDDLDAAMADAERQLPGVTGVINDEDEMHIIDIVELHSRTARTKGGSTAIPSSGLGWSRSISRLNAPDAWFPDRHLANGDWIEDRRRGIRDVEELGGEE